MPFHHRLYILLIKNQGCPSERESAFELLASFWEAGGLSLKTQFIRKMTRGGWVPSLSTWASQKERWELKP